MSGNVVVEIANDTGKEPIPGSASQCSDAVKPHTKLQGGEEFVARGPG